MRLEELLAESGTAGDKSQAVVSYLWKKQLLHKAMEMRDGAWFVTNREMVLRALQALYGKAA